MISRSITGLCCSSDSSPPPPSASPDPPPRPTSAISERDSGGWFCIRANANAPSRFRTRRRIDALVMIDLYGLLEPLRGDLIERPPVSVPGNLLPGVLLIAANNTICIFRIDLHKARSPVAALTPD